MRYGHVKLRYVACFCFFMLALAAVSGYAASRVAVAAAVKSADTERTALEFQVELNRLGSSGDPIEREELLRKIIEKCGGTEEAEAAYWALADLYLDAFNEPKEKEAREILELFLKRCPDSRWATVSKCKLLALYDAKDKRAAELRRELKSDKALPQILRSALKL